MIRKFLASLVFCICSLSVAESRELNNDSSVAIVNKVVSSACLDFKAHLGAQRGATTDFEKFALDVDNYKMTVYKQDGVYVVEFVPKRYQGVALRGGASTYRVDPRSGAVLGISRTK